ncbi:AraC family transcriptional regulator [Rhodoferax aquaticus]|uniref:AraC family transcriptional regulator n=1 Tax=Rhodoferax aquaticus TaxID=2527691 RepID=A0A515EW90_9BURK|nr:AraC family transcriptional regulator [Rhodoferax aquaticus]
MPNPQARAPGLEFAQYCQPGRAGVEIFTARFVHHTFDPHTHEAFGLGVIEQGVERFRYAGAEHLAPANSLVMIHPDEVHTGRAETVQGWRYRMAYIDPQVLENISGQTGWWFAQAVAPTSAAQAHAVAQVLEALSHAAEPLAVDCLLHRLVDHMRPYARTALELPTHGRLRFAPVLDYLHAYYAEPQNLEGLAQLVGLSPFHFLRQFQKQFHVTPQQMLMAIRLHRAKGLLAQGEPAAQVAAATGLTDQAHLTRTFARRYGITPGRYQQQLNGADRNLVQDRM